jgi:hypothetical protein
VGALEAQPDTPKIATSEKTNVLFCEKIPQKMTGFGGARLYATFLNRVARFDQE